MRIESCLDAGKVHEANGNECKADRSIDSRPRPCTILYSWVSLHRTFIRSEFAVTLSVNLPSYLGVAISYE